MDSHTPTAHAVTPLSPQPPPRPDPSTGDDVEAAYRIVTATVAIAFGLARPNLECTGQPVHQGTPACQVAMYLMHVGFGVSMARVGQAFRRHRTTVSHACHVVEDRRDEPRFDRLLDSLEQAAAALRNAHRIYHQR